MMCCRSEVAMAMIHRRCGAGTPVLRWTLIGALGCWTACSPARDVPPPNGELETHVDAAFEAETDSSTPAAPDAEDGPPADEPPADDGTPQEPEAGAPEADGPTAGTDGDPGACPTCTAPTPVCLDGACVACSAADGHQCAAFEVCDPQTHTCVENAPFALDCARLPAHGACPGGPREVVLGMQKDGLIAMFDPYDGHYLGWFSRRSIPKTSTAGGAFTYGADYFFATQGPDQCIWTVVASSYSAPDGAQAIDRLDTDGAFKDALIRLDKHFVIADDGFNEDVIDRVRSIAFTSDAVYVASTDGVPNPRVSRFGLDGTFEGVVLDDGSEVESLLVLRDGSMVIANSQTGNVELLTPDRSRRRVVARPVHPGQVSYAGAGSLLTVDTDTGGRAYRVKLATGEVEDRLPWKYDIGGNTELSGITALGNGQWLVSMSPFGVRSLNPSSTSPAGQHSLLMEADPFTPNLREFNYFGRACLPEALVASRAPAVDVPLASCAVPAGEPLFAADFEDGLDGFAVHTPLVEPGVEPAILTATRDSTGPANAALRIAGGDPRAVYVPRVVVSLPNLRPSFVEFSLRVQDAASAASFRLAAGSKPGADALAAISVSGGRLTGSQAAFIQQWVRIQLREIDWTRRTYDLYVTRPGNDADCTRVASDVLFERVSGDGIQLLELSSFAEASVIWFDDIVIK
jgi:hypothetical protein